jgi:hypothetical protein
MRKRRRAKQRTAQEPPATPQRSRWYRGAVWAGAAAVISWLLLYGPTALTNAEQLIDLVPQKLVKLRDWYYTDNTWTGTWTNEGSIGEPMPEMFVTMDLRVYRGFVDGTIRTSGFPNRAQFPYEFVLLDGEKRNDGALQVNAFDYIDNKRVEFATFIMHPDGVLQRTSQSIAFFPRRAELWRTDPRPVASKRANSSAEKGASQSGSSARKLPSELQYKGGAQ